MARATVVCFINYKGGVGKTTTTYHIGCSLAEHHGKRVLLVDIDPQCNLALLCMSYESYARIKESKRTIGDLYQLFRSGYSPLRAGDYIVANAVRPGGVPIEGVDLLPCDIDFLGEDLGGVVPAVSSVRGSNAYQVLQQFAQKMLREWKFLRLAFDEVAEAYDYILIDCPPNLYMMTQNALVASAWYLITLIPEYLSAIGANTLIRKINTLDQRIEKVAALADEDGLKRARFGGVICVKRRATTQHDETVKRLKEAAGVDGVFENFTSELIGYSEAAEQQMPIWHGKTQNVIFASNRREYERITEEFLSRCTSPERTQ